MVLVHATIEVRAGAVSALHRTNVGLPPHRPYLTFKYYAQEYDHIH
jgi:hypothetical protein